MADTKATTTNTTAPHPCPDLGQAAAHLKKSLRELRRASALLSELARGGVVPRFAGNALGAHQEALGEVLAELQELAASDYTAEFGEPAWLLGAAGGER